MGKASSAKKVARAARAGGGARGGRRRSLAFPSAVVTVVVLGVALVVFARSSKTSEASTPPIAGRDHWHIAYGVYNCDSFEAPFDSTDDPRGIHSHQDGVIHIHPFSSDSGGENATLELFMESMGASLDDDSLSLPGRGNELREGPEACGGEGASLKVAYWSSVDEEVEPQIVTDSLSDVRLRHDRGALTIAFVPDGAEIPKPESIPELDQLTDVDTGPSGTSGAPATDDPAATTATTAAGEGTDPTATTPTTAPPSTAAP